MVNVGIAPKCHWFWLRCIVALSVALLCEVAVFNAPYWRSLSSSTSFTPTMSAGTGLQPVPCDGLCYKVVHGGDPERSDPPRDADNYLLLDTRDRHVDFLTLDMSLRSGGSGSRTNEVNVRLVAADSRYRAGMALPVTTVSTLTPAASRLSVKLMGPSPWVRVLIEEPAGTVVQAKRIVINETVPFHVSIPRLVALSAVALVMAMLLPGSTLWRRQWNDRTVAARLTLAAIMALQVASVLAILWVQAPWLALDQLKSPHVLTIYQDQFQSLLNGHAWLQEQPPKELVAMQYPYDTSMRMQTGANSLENKAVIVDYAYRDGKYWCYFGILPVILFMFPCYWLTGQVPDTWMMVLACSLAMVPASYRLVRALLRRYAPHASFGTLASCLLAFPALTFAPLLIGDPGTYTLPNSLGLLLCVCAFASWLSACKDANTLRTPFLAAGSLLMGLTLGTRPTLSCAALLALPLFWPYLRRRKTRLRHWIAMIAPAMAAAAPILWWNLIRFGSLFDFGSAYNITVVNMTSHPWNPDMIPLTLFENLLRPVSAEWRWPFIFPDADMDYAYQARISTYSMAGGYFHFVPIAFFGLFAAWYHLSGDKSDEPSEGKEDANGTPAPMIVASSIGALLLCILVTAVGGLNARYITDWAWLLAIPAIIGLGLLDQTIQHTRQPLRIISHAAICLAAIISLLLVCWLAICDYAPATAHGAQALIQLRTLLLPN